MAVSKSRHYLNVQFPRIHRIDGKDQFSHSNDTICKVLNGWYIFREFIPIGYLLVSTTCMLTYCQRKMDKYNPDILLFFLEIAENYPNEFIRSQGNSEKTLRITRFLWKKTQIFFCYFYQKASLAAENNNWKEVVNL